MSGGELIAVIVVAILLLLGVAGIDNSDTCEDKCEEE